MTPIRVLEIVAGFAVEGPLGGIERFGIELCRALDRRQVEPILCGLWRFGTPYEEQWQVDLQREGIHAFLAAARDQAHPYRGFVHSWQGIRRELAGQRVDIVHSHSEFGDGIALLLARSLGTRRLVRTVHNELEWPKRPGRRLFLTNLLYPLLFQCEIGISRQAADNLDRRWLARRLGKHSPCIYNAIDLRRFASPVRPSAREARRAELGVSPDEPLLGTVGRLTAQKGYGILLEAMSLVLPQVPAARLVIVGDGELVHDLRDRAVELGLEQAVRFTGPRQDVEELLSAMDVFVSSSLWEGLPTVILESMAAGVPVVATDVSGSRELVRDGSTGLLVPPGNAGALAEGIVQLLQDRKQGEELAMRARQEVRRFSMTSVAQEHLHLYQSLLAGQ
jgi:glycosyltransferase involved in cell wall biosynthesis